MNFRTILGGVCVATLMATAAQAATVSRVVLKASDTTPQTGTAVVDPYLDWTGTGGVNEGVADANTIANNGIDFKDSWVDSNWGIVESARVSFYTTGNEVAWLEFDTLGTTKSDFFDLTNLTGSSWGTTGFPGQDPVNSSRNGQFFSIEGAASIDRHWYVNNNWGGCSNDSGWFVVLDGRTPPSYACPWEDNQVGLVGTSGRGFLYSTLPDGNPDHQNFNASGIGIADTFAITVSYDDGISAVPVPASALLLLSAIGGVAGLRRRRKS